MKSLAVVGLVCAAAIALLDIYELHIGGRPVVAYKQANIFGSEYAAATEGALNYLLAILLILLQLLACDNDHDATFDNDPWYMRRIDRLLYS